MKEELSFEEQITKLKSSVVGFCFRTRRGANRRRDDYGSGGLAPAKHNGCISPQIIIRLRTSNHTML